MRIPFWQSLLFFLVIIFLGIKLFPSGREMGIFYFKSRDYAQVEMYLKEQFYKDPKDLANAFRYLGTLDENGKFDLFEQEGQKILAVYPENSKVRQFMAKFYEDRLMLAKAAQQWTKILDIEPDNEKYLNKLIAYDQSNKNYGELIRIYEDQVKKADAAPENYYELARLYAVNHRLSKAKAMYEELVVRYPKDSKAKRKLAELLEILSDVDGALDLYRQIAEADPKDQSAYAQFLEKLLFFNRQNDAFNLMTKTIQGFKDIRPFVQVVSGYSGKWRDKEEWQALLDIFYQRDSQDPITIRLLAELFYNEKDYEKALSLLTELHNRDYCDYYTHYLMGNAYSFLSDRESAQNQYNLAMKHYERRSEFYNSVSDKLIKADILRRLGRRNESLLVLNLILRQNPKNPLALELAAGNYLDLKRIPMAKEYLEKLYMENQEDVDVLKSLGELYVLLEDYKNAEKILRSYHEKTGGDYRSYHMYGNVLAAIGDESGSQRAYRQALRLIRR